jgi:ATP-dependent protease ClpP protease subunit
MFKALRTEVGGYRPHGGAEQPASPAADIPSAQAANSQDDCPEPAQVNAATDPAGASPRPPKLRYGAVPIVVPPIKTYPHIIERMEDTRPIGYDIYLFDVINTFSKDTLERYQDLIQILDYAPEGLPITLYLDTVGGVIPVGAALASAIKRSKAVVTTVAVGSVMSMGTVLWAAGDVRKVLPSAVFMFHQSSHGSYGNSNEIAATAEAIADYARRYLLEPMVAEGLLTQNDLEIIQRQEDLYISSAVMQTRLDDLAKKAAAQTNAEPAEEGSDHA